MCNQVIGAKNFSRYSIKGKRAGIGSLNVYCDQISDQNEIIKAGSGFRFVL